VLPLNQRPGQGPSAPVDSTAEVRVFIGPTNSAGQAWRWARAIEQYLPSAAAVSMRVTGAREFGHPADQSVGLGTYRWSKRWRSDQRALVESEFSHVIIESARPLFSDLADSVRREVERLQRRGVQVALLFHGTDIRLPSRHAENEQGSPFRGSQWNMTGLLQAQAEANARLVGALGLPVFYSTPDLLLDLPDAEWLPVVIDPESWRTHSAPLTSGELPSVAHAPSRSIVKGSDLIDPVLQRLEAEGVIEYRRVEGVPAEHMPAVYRGVDIVVDQFRIGNYGVAACEAMAAGRIVVSHVSEFVRDQVAQRTGTSLPIVEATRDTLEETVRAIIDDSASYRSLAESGIRFTEAVHDGRMSAEVLSAFLRAPAGR